MNLVLFVGLTAILGVTAGLWCWIYFNWKMTQEIKDKLEKDRKYMMYVDKEDLPDEQTS